jgi:catalase
MASIRIGVARLVPRFIQVRQLGHSYKVDPTYGNHVAERLGIKIDEIMRKAA